MHEDGQEAHLGREERDCSSVPVYKGAFVLLLLSYVSSVSALPTLHPAVSQRRKSQDLTGERSAMLLWPACGRSGSSA